MRIYLDTSVYVTEFSEETPLSELAKKIFEKCEQNKLTIVTSYWTLSEGIVAIDKALRRMDVIMNRPKRNAIISTLLGRTFDMVKQKKIVLMVPTEDFITGSWKYIRERCLSADDALHAFSAEVGKCDMLVVADNGFANRLREKNEDEDNPLETHQLTFEVYNLRDVNDYRLLEQKIDSC
jgi:predicted nucleic acid-binding protein